MPRSTILNITLYTILYITRCIIVRCIITRCTTSLLIGRIITKNKKPEVCASGFLFISIDDYAFAVVVFVFCAGVAVLSPPRGLPLAKSTRKGAATKIEE